MVDKIKAAIQVIPPGLLGFLDLKSLGQNPLYMGDTVQPVWNTQEWYFSAREQQTSSSTASLAAGATGFQQFSPRITIPQDEQWWVRNVTITTPVLAGVAQVQYSFSWSSTVLTGGFNYVEGVDETFQGTAGANGRGALTTGRFFLPPGAELGVFVNLQEVAAGIQLTGQVRYTPLPI